MGHIERVFNALEYSCPMYRNDNLSMLHDDLSPTERKRFFLARHRFSKQGDQNGLLKHQVIEAFDPLFHKPN